MDRSTISEAYRRAVAACDPEEAVASALGRDDLVQLVEGSDRVIVIAIGKAAAAMARGAASVVPEIEGIAVSDHREECPIPLLVGDHPIPGEASLAAGAEALDVVSSTGPEDVLLFLVSGGGSALAESLVPGVTAADLSEASRLLIEGGAPIEDINEVRAALSTTKAGRLAAAAGTQRISTLLLSDVVGAGPEVVASGPSIPSSLGSRAGDVLERSGLADAMPASVVAAVTEGRRPVDRINQPVIVLGSTETSAAVAASHIRAQGEEPHVLTTALMGRSEPAVRRILDALDDHPAVIASGETIVEVSGGGLGGRNQHAALLAAIAIEGTDIVFGALGTDGRDGPTDAAGAIVDGTSTERMRVAGVEPSDAVASCDSYRALEASGDLVITGPSGTNVADLWIAGRSVG